MSGTTKTVAERLREAANLDGKICDLAAMLGTDTSCRIGSCYKCWQATMNALADDIEAEQTELRKQGGVDVDALLSLADYFERMGNDTFAWTRVTAADPHRWKGTIRDAVKGANASKPTPLPEGVEWPRFEDGELVKFGDEWLNKCGLTEAVKGIDFGKEYFTINFVAYDYGTLLKRPEPEVLDADGVPIRVGDTVWYEDKEWRVTDVYVCSDGEGGVNLDSLIKVEYDEPVEAVANAWNKLITHRKPDTQEAINDDATMPYYTYCSKVLKIEEAQTTEEMVTAMAQDLLARQRKLLGGE